MHLSCKVVVRYSDGCGGGPVVVRRFYLCEECRQQQEEDEQQQGSTKMSEPGRQGSLSCCGDWTEVDNIDISVSSCKCGTISLNSKSVHLNIRWKIRHPPWQSKRCEDSHVWGIGVSCTRFSGVDYDLWYRWLLMHSFLCTSSLFLNGWPPSMAQHSVLCTGTGDEMITYTCVLWNINTFIPLWENKLTDLHTYSMAMCFM